ncbi:hypothetical protein [Streptomyces sp. GbtcB6]|uniref:hypothetical protein n=1 Tax=Streptomyces sp. GbtcB6 TaxID=2824751 RepID=UPI001C300A4B|nr:hypothetical protein [Streptomyces sp. GbtcB6]
MPISLGAAKEGDAGHWCASKTACALVSGERAVLHKAAELYLPLRACRKTLPWSREPHPGWLEGTEWGKEHSGRPETPGWTLKQVRRYDELFEELRKATEAVQA